MPFRSYAWLSPGSRANGRELARLLGAIEYLVMGRSPVEVGERRLRRRELRITFEGIEDPLVLRVKQVSRPFTVIWDVESTATLPEWVGTTIAFMLSEPDTGGCDVRFRHEGLSPRLECYDHCRTSWDQYLASLRDYIDSGTGQPFSPARLG